MDRLKRSADAKAPYGGCPVERGYLLLEHRCLKLYFIKRNYSDAVTRCEGDRGHLFNLKSRDNDAPALLMLMETMGKDLGTMGKSVWVGANDIKEAKVFRWSDNTTLATDSELWADGQPDDMYDDVKNVECVRVSYMNEVVLDDVPRSMKLWFACQVDISTELMTNNVLSTLYISNVQSAGLSLLSLPWHTGEDCPC